jgi:hypothetical protein
VSLLLLPVALDDQKTFSSFFALPNHSVCLCKAKSTWRLWYVFVSLFLESLSLSLARTHDWRLLVVL